MNRLKSFAALTAAALIASLSASAWSGNVSEQTWSVEPTSTEPAAPAEAAPPPAGHVVPGRYAQPWQQAPHWRAPRQAYGYPSPQYPQGGQYPGYPARPAAAPAAHVNPLTAELQQAQEQLAAKNSELIEARNRIEQLDGKLQDSLAAQTALSDKATYSTREQNALRVRVTELVKTMNTANTTLEQQRQLINHHQAHNQTLTAERDQLHNELASRDAQLAALRSELQAATQALAQARARARAAIEALGGINGEPARPDPMDQTRP